MRAALWAALCLWVLAADEVPHVVDKPILFGPRRIMLTQQYIKRHYGIDAKNIEITPRMIVVHYSAKPTLQKTFETFYSETLSSKRTDIAAASKLNVSVHYLVDRDGTIYRLMPDHWMARHVIGLNLSAVGIENVGFDDLTPAQLEADTRLIRHLRKKYPTIRYLIGHYEYRTFEHSPLWLEKYTGYRTFKQDPGPRFMEALHRRFPYLRRRP